MGLFAQDSLSRREAVDRALHIHPLLAGAAGRIAATEGLRQQAGLLPNPRLFLQVENLRATGQPGLQYGQEVDHFAYLSNTFESASKRQRRVDFASAGVQRAGLEQELLRRQISGRVALAYWTAAGARRTEALLEEAVRNFDGIVEYHRVRVQEGSMAESDLIRIRLEQQRLRIDLNRAHLESERTRIQLLREMGQTQFPPVTLTDSVEASASRALAGDADAAVAQRTEVKLARAAMEQARANQRLQTAYARPNYDALFGYKRTAGFNTVMGGFQMDLPVMNKNQGNIAASAAEIRVAESNLAAVEAVVRAEVQATWTEYEIRRRELTELLHPLVSQADETYRIAEGAYKLGGSDLLRLLDAQRIRIEARTAEARGLAGIRQAEAALETALGVEP